VVVDRIAFEPQAQRLPVDRADDLRRHQWITPEHAPQRCCIHRPTFKMQGGIELAFAVAHDIHMHMQMRTRRGESPTIVARHAHERRDVELFGERPVQRAAVNVGGFDGQHIGVAFFPRRVGDFGDDAVERDAVDGVAVVKAHRIEGESGVAEVRQQADGALRTTAEYGCGALAHGIAQRLFGIAEIVAASELGKIASLHRP
jgi:hypothetical protein